MQVKQGYRQTEVGVIPEEWDVKTIGSIAPIATGSTPPTRDPANYGEDFLFVSPADMGAGKRIFRTEKKLSAKGFSISRPFPPGSVLFVCIGSTIGKCGIATETLTSNQQVNAVLPSECVSPDYLYYALSAVSPKVRSLAGEQAVPIVNKRAFADTRIPFPATNAEQEAIAEVLGDVDELIESLERLIAKKRAQRQGAMQELLTGKKRLPGFSKNWNVKHIAEIASPISRRNSAGEQLAVLTCSKHLGFVDSLKYFKNQVFSRDTRGYKIIERGQLGYPANHIEEGSIGLQDLYDVALVSPIYVVFSVAEGVNKYFLHRLLKLDSYQQLFETATSASVDRRGSLRWPAFSEIAVRMPEIEEQSAIAGVLSDMDAEISALDEKLGKACLLRLGMVQELLTGRTRLV